jgi:DMSO/TMAO reductase YedYZ molybdopterin-dependent catalytic subunit
MHPPAGFLQLSKAEESGIMANCTASLFYPILCEVHAMMIRLIPATKLLGLALLIAGLAACTTPPAPAQLPSTPIAVVAPKPTLCALPAVVAPTPSANPGYTNLDADTGLHVTGQAQTIDLAGYRLKVSGRVANPLELTYDELRCLPRLDCRCTITCPGFFADTTDWAGASLAGVLKLADVQRDAQSVELIGADGYSTVVTVAEALADDNFLATEWAGQPVPVLHGFPVRAVFPRLTGGTWVKWLTEIRVK